MVEEKDLQSRLCTWENIWLAYRKAARGKRGRYAAAAFEYRLADNLIALQEGLETRSYQPGDYNSFYIHEPKRRLISAAPFADRVAHHALCNVTQPYFERLFIANSFANRVGKGTHRAIEQCQIYARRYEYFLQCDVVQFFPSVDHLILKKTLAEMLPDQSVHWLIECILRSGEGVLSEAYSMVYFPGDDLLAAVRPRGLPIGNLTSQLWANCFMNPFDHFIRRELGCRAYLRYVDDFVLFGNDKRQMMVWLGEIIKRLERLRLTIHVNRSHPRHVREGIPFLGFVIYPDHRLLKRRKGIAFRQRLKKLKLTANKERLTASIRGWINHVRYGNTWGLRTAVLKECGLLAEEYLYA